MERNCKIVTYDWLEDSLLKQTRKREGQYLLQRLEQESRKAKFDQKTKERTVTRATHFTPQVRAVHQPLCW